MKKYIFVVILFFGFLSSSCGKSTDKENIACPGGNGTAGTIYGDGIPGCDGGTNPDKYGKFYLKGSKNECNPSQCDLERSNKNKP